MKEDIRETLRRIENKLDRLELRQPWWPIPQPVIYPNWWQQPIICRGDGTGKDEFSTNIYNPSPNDNWTSSTAGESVSQ